MGDVIDIRQLLQGQSLEHAERYARGLLAVALAFCKYADIDPDQFALMIANAQDAESIDAATVAILEAIGYW